MHKRDSALLIARGVLFNMLINLAGLKTQLDERLRVLIIEF